MFLLSQFLHPVAQFPYGDTKPAAQCVLFRFNVHKYFLLAKSLRTCWSRYRERCRCFNFTFPATLATSSRAHTFMMALQNCSPFHLNFLSVEHHCCPCDHGTEKAAAGAAQASSLEHISTLAAQNLRPFHPFPPPSARRGSSWPRPPRRISFLPFRSSNKGPSQPHIYLRISSTFSIRRILG